MHGCGYFASSRRRMKTGQANSVCFGICFATVTHSTQMHVCMYECMSVYMYACMHVRVCRQVGWL